MTRKSKSELHVVSKSPLKQFEETEPPENVHRSEYNDKAQTRDNSETDNNIHRSLKKSTFRERPSYLDSEDSLASKGEFRGIFNLFALGLSLFFLSTESKYILYEGTLVGINSFFSMFNRFDLFPTWILLVLWSFLVYILQKFIVKRLISDAFAIGLYICVLFSMLIGTVIVALERNWPVVQTAFFLSEGLVLSMKIHSYFMTNRMLAKESRILESKGEISQYKDGTYLRYPQNVTISNFVFFLLIPTLVYEIEYPRRKRIRFRYLFEKIAAFGGMWAVLHVLIHSYITPVLEKTPQISVLEAISLLLVPVFACYLLIFYIVFEVACNGFAELTRFADREFYQDWWNSTTWDEFARKWSPLQILINTRHCSLCYLISLFPRNRPVHEWLLRHVYLESINTYKLPSVKAAFITFLISSIFHELFLAVTLRLLRPWLFFLQMLQFPLILLGRHFKRKTIGNLIFWFGLMIGPPTLSILYCREFYMETSHIPTMV